MPRVDEDEERKGAGLTVLATKRVRRSILRRSGCAAVRDTASRSRLASIFNGQIQSPENLADKRWPGLVYLAILGIEQHAFILLVISCMKSLIPHTHTPHISTGALAFAWMEVPEVHLRNALKRVLSNEMSRNGSDISDLSYSNLSSALEHELALPSGALKDRKGEITDLILESNLFGSVEQLEEIESGVGKKGKFSATETKIILDEIHSYMDENELSLEDICPELRDERVKTPHLSLWTRLLELLPLRSKNVRPVPPSLSGCLTDPPQQIYSHAMRKITELGLKKGIWSLEEKETLKSLVTSRSSSRVTLPEVAIHGRDWRKISRLINRSTGQIFFSRPPISSLQATAKTPTRFCWKENQVCLPPCSLSLALAGRFSKEENEALIAAIRKVCHIPGSPASDRTVLTLPPKIQLLSQKCPPKTFPGHMSPRSSKINDSHWITNEDGQV
jgi:hypothetical protein